MADVHAPDTPPFDSQALLRRLHGDAALAKAMAALLLQELPAQTQALHRAVETANVEGVAQVAHALRGAVSNFGADEVARAAYNLERMAVDGRLADSADAQKTFDDAVARLIPALRELTA
ncbi:MAG: Hpt domain-containing protein [Gemmatimonadaceae bacterium]|nr:Hpt domain-containing protein [Gemmatimonadaceae bacterium]